MRAYPFARLPGPALAAVKWCSIAIVVVAVVPVLLLSTRRSPAPSAPVKAEPVRSLPLTLTGEGGRLTLGWDSQAPVIQAGQCGMLWIADGGILRRVTLNTSQLRAGTLFYWPVNKDVSFEIKMSAADNRSGEPACGDNATALPQPVERAARREQRAERTASRSRPNTARIARRESIEIRQPEVVSAGMHARIESRNAAAFAIEGESQLIAPLPVHAFQFQPVSEQIFPAAIVPAPLFAPERYSTVTVEAVPESRMSRLASKIPLLGRRRRAAEFLGPRPVRETPRQCPRI